MVLLLEKLGFTHKSSTKMNNHHHHSQPLMTYLQAFQSHVSNHWNQLSSNSQPNSDFLSLTHIKQCLELISIVNKAFAKLVMDIDYPMSKWDVPFIDEYLNHTLELLELLNSLSSSVSHLSQARLSLSHALGLVENSPSLAMEHLKPVIVSKSCSKCFREESKEESTKEMPCYGKVWVVQQALMVMKSTGFSGFWSELTMEKRGVQKEVKEVNDAVACLVSAMATKKGVDTASNELQRRLEVFEKVLDGVGKCSNHLFSEVLAARNELLDNLRQQVVETKTSQTIYSYFIV